MNLFGFDHIFRNDQDLNTCRCLRELNDAALSLQQIHHIHSWQELLEEAEPDFKMFTRKMHQDFRAAVNGRSFENAIGLTIEDVNHFFVADDEKIYTFDDITYEK